MPATMKASSKCTCHSPQAFDDSCVLDIPLKEEELSLGSF